MTCFYPLRAWLSRQGGVTFNKSQGYSDRPLTLPCGQCIGCRLERSRQWAVRCEHEAQLHARNCFVTLTFSDEALLKRDCPDWLRGSVDVRDMQLFFKRLRKRHGKFRRFYCGEYGEKLGRPHYHACIFGLDFPDKVLLKVHNGERYYISDDLSSLWPFGHCVIGDVTFESSAYIARYCTKKITGEAADYHYRSVCPVTGEIAERRPEFLKASSRPAIGRDWIMKFTSDVWNGGFDDDRVVSRGIPMRPPRYYEKVAEKEFPELMRGVKARRISASKEHAADQTPARLKVRDKVKRAQFGLLKRSYEFDGTDNLFGT